MTGWLRASLHDLTHPPASQNGGLDALRTLAILLVVVAHCGRDWNAAMGSNAFTKFPLVAMGWSGVDLFFCLSGFLIGRQLLREIKGSGDLRIGRFLLRRGLRIWPLYYATLAAVLVFEPSRRAFHSWWPDLVFLSNYFVPAEGYGGTVHGGWSLCIEEQFYLVAPVSFVVLARLGVGPAVQRLLLAGTLALLPLVRAAVWQSVLAANPANPTTEWWRIYFPFHTHCDGLVLGLLLAHLSVYPPRWADGRPRWLAPLVATSLVVAVHAVLAGVSDWVAGFTRLSAVYGLLTWFAVRDPQPWRRTAALPFFVLSRLSYGMYLNHAYLLGAVCAAVGAHVDGAAGAALAAFVAVVASMLVATVTFAVVERPFLQLRERWIDASRREAVS